MHIIHTYINYHILLIIHVKKLLLFHVFTFISQQTFMVTSFRQPSQYSRGKFHQKPFVVMKVKMQKFFSTNNKNIRYCMHINAIMLQSMYIILMANTYTNTHKYVHISCTLMYKVQKVMIKGGSQLVWQKYFMTDGKEEKRKLSCMVQLLSYAQLITYSHYLHHLPSVLAFW